MSALIEKIVASAGGTWLAFISLALLGLALSCIEVSKIQLNPWTAIKKAVWDFFDTNHTNQKLDATNKRLDEIESLLKGYIAEDERREASENRRRILAFEREVLFEVKHLKEEFDDILETIRQYESYCESHKEYRNHIADEAIKHIEEVYRERLRKHDFGKE